MVNILLVEDEILINELVEEFLKNNGYQVVPCFDGLKALELFDKEIFNLVLLDIMIPKKTGLEVLQEIRKKSKVPIIMLTAMSDEQTQLISFNQHIDDYVTKPFSPTILLKRIENVLRKNTEIFHEKSLEFEKLKIIEQSCDVYYDKKLIVLTKKEFDILYLLVKNTNKTVTREQIISFVWQYELIVDTRIIDNHIRNIRKKIPELHIITTKGIGYRIEGKT